MTEISESFFINKCSSMSFKELGEYIVMCFEYLENPQKHLADVKKAPILKETYDVLIERLESKLTGIENLFHCRNQLESFRNFELFKVEMSNFNTLVNYHQAIENDKKNIEDEIYLTKRKVNESLSILLQCLFSEMKTASVFVNSSEPYFNILTWLYKLSESNKEIKKIYPSNLIVNLEIGNIPMIKMRIKISAIAIVIALY